MAARSLSESVPPPASTPRLRACCSAVVTELSVESAAESCPCTALILCRYPLLKVASSLFSTSRAAAVGLSEGWFTLLPVEIWSSACCSSSCVWLSAASRSGMGFGLTRMECLPQERDWSLNVMPPPRPCQDLLHQAARG